MIIMNYQNLPFSSLHSFLLLFQNRNVLKILYFFEDDDDDDKFDWTKKL